VHVDITSNQGGAAREAFGQKVTLGLVLALRGALRARELQRELGNLVAVLDPARGTADRRASSSGLAQGSEEQHWIDPDRARDGHEFDHIEPALTASEPMNENHSAANKQQRKSEKNESPESSAP
jgi:hypothetical protein